MGPSTHVCPGCQRSFQPGGYANHLRFSHDPRCRSIRSSLLQTSPDVLLPSHSHPPIPGPPPVPEPQASPDVEMMDIDNDLEPPVDPGSDLPSFGPMTPANQAGEWDEVQPSELDPIPNGFPATDPCRPPRGVVVVDSETDSDLSDDDDCGNRPSHRDRQISPPGLTDNGSPTQTTATRTPGMFVRLFSIPLILMVNTSQPKPHRTPESEPYCEVWWSSRRSDREIP